MSNIRSAIKAAIRASIGFGVAATVLVAAYSASAQVAPELILSHPHAARFVTGPNMLGRFLEGDELRIGVVANPSSTPTTVVAEHAGATFPIPYYQAAVIDEIYEIRLPFSADLTGAWTFGATRGTATATATTSGLPAAFAVPLLDQLDLREIDGEQVLTWLWPDLSEAMALGLRIEADVRTMQEDNYDDFLIQYGLPEHFIPPRAAGEEYVVHIPRGGLEAGKLFLFRVHLSFYNAAGQLLAQSVTFARHLYSPPAD
ncbi:MAG: hypothetical protein ACWA6X_01500 [Bauldia sp.]